MKRLVALLLAFVLVLSLFAGCNRNEPEEPTEGSTEPVEVDDGICETAQECVDNITVGWNLGCSLSAFASESIEAWGVMAYFHTPDKLYSRSEVHLFDPETRTAEISWILGKDGGVMQVYEGALMDYIGIELWNFSLGESDVLKYSIDELRYVTAEGEVVVTEGLGEMSTDMGGGTGGGPVADLDEPAVADIQEIHAKVTFIEQTKGESTPESIAAAEMSWGNPVTTQAMIDKVRDRGFNMIRVQVSYVNHMDEEGNIDPLWLERVAEVVDYCMNAGVYCLINTTGAGWMTADPETFEEQGKIYARLWEQIAERFADYGELLLFESCNEVLNSNNQWWNPPAECYDVMNGFYQIFVDTVRAAGGYNETRNLVLNPYAAAYDYHMNQGFKLPNDTVEGHLIAQVHCYEPNNFCFNETNLGSTNFANEWGTDAEKRKLDEIMKNIRKRFVDELGIPVIIGEFGTVNRVVEEERAEYIGYYAKAADQYGIKLIIFDDGGDFTVFDRTTLIWPYVKVIDALFNKDAPAHDVEDEVVELDENVEGWQALIYFSGTDGSWNRSDAFNFDPENNTAEIVWKLGQDNGILGAIATAGIDGLGVELWNFDKGAGDFAKYVVEQIVLVTDSGERVIEDGLGEYSTDMSGGTGGGTVVDLMDNPTVGTVTEIRAKIKLLGSYVKDVGPAKEPLDVPDSVPSVQPVTSPMEGWSAKIYMSATDFTYNTSVATQFDAATKTAKIVWVLGQDEGVYTAAANAGIDIIGVDLWNFSLDEKTTINYWIKDLKYYTTKKTVDVPVLQDSFKTDMSGGTGGGTVADLDAPALSDIVAIYMEVQIDAKSTGSGTTGSTVSGLPTVTEPANALENYQAVLYLATNQTGFNRSDPPVSFDANTKTAEVLWKLEEGREAGFVTAGDSEGLTVIGAQIYNFAEKPSSVKYTVESLKYYTKSGSGYKENVVSLSQKNFTTSLAASGAGGGTVASLAVPPAVGDVVAIYAKIKLNISDSGTEEPEPDTPTEGLPTVTPSANPMTTGVRMYLATKQTGYNTSAWSNFDTATKQAEVLWMMNDGTVFAGAAELLGTLGVEAADYTSYPAEVKIRIDELKYYTASGESAVAHNISANPTELTLALADGMDGLAVASFGETGPAIGDIVAIYLKATMLVDDEQPEGACETAAQAVQNINVGWNLGLSLSPYKADGTPFASVSEAETYWGNPATTQQMINAVRDRGFNAVRIQVSFLNHMDAQGNIDEAWLNRVAEVVDYCMAADVYCILGTTGAGWLTAERSTFASQSAVYANLWSQLAAKFASYGDKLLFESCNEVLTAAGQWSNPPAEAYQVMNDLYQVFVDTVRATGGNNETRNLVLNPYAATYDYTMNQNFALPTDKYPGHLIAQVHCYEPNNFCFNETNLGSTNFTNEWGTDAEKATIDSIMQNIKKRFVDELGIPVIIGEFGTVKRVSEDERAEYVGYFAQAAAANGIKVFIFDDGGDFAVFNRNDLSWPYGKIIKALMGESSDENQLPTITAPTNPMYTGAKMYLATAQTGYNSPADYSHFDADTGVVEVLYLMSDSSVTAADTEILGAVGLQLADYVTSPAELKLKIDALQYYTPDGDGYKAVDIPVAAETLTVDLSGGSYAGVISNITEGPAMGDVAALYLKMTIITEEEPDVPAETPVQLPTVTASTNPTYTGVRLYLASPYTVSEYAQIDGTTNSVEVLWRMDNGSMSAYSTMPLTDICAEVTNYTDVLTTLKIKVEALKYYQSIDGGYREVDVPVAQPEQTLDMSAKTVGTALGAPADSPAIGTVAAVYLKLSLVTEEEEPGETPVQLPTVTAPANTLYTGAKMYLATVQTGYNAPVDFVNFNADTNTVEVLYMMDDPSVTAADTEILGAVGLQLADYVTSPAELKLKIDALQYYTPLGTGYKAVDIPVAAETLTVDLSGGSYAGVISNITEGPAMGDVTALYLKMSIVTEEPAAFALPRMVAMLVDAPEISLEQEEN